MAKKILLVDDEPDLLEVTRMRLEKSGYEVIAAANGKDALNALQRVAPDMVLLDLLLPDIRGEEICRKIKSDPKFKDIPVILFTASTSAVAQISLEYGAQGYINKPFEAEELLKMIKEFIS